MDCSDAKPELERFASDRLTPSERTPIEEHLAMCEECSLEVELIRNRGAAPSTGESDWTVEKIFGAEAAAAAPRGERAEAVDGVMQGPYAGAGESDGDDEAEESPSRSGAPRGGASRPNEPIDSHARAAEPPPPPPAPTGPPAIERPSMILPLPQADPDEAPAAAAQGGPKRPARDRRGKTEAKPAEESWDFEPAGAKVGQTPPEETVQLAETALGRRNDRSSAKSAATRALLWGIGGLAGVVLLGASIWLAITVHRAPEPATVSRPYGGGAKTRAADPGPEEIATADSVPASVTAPEAPAGDARPMAASNGAPISPLPVEPKAADGATTSGATRNAAPQTTAPPRDARVVKPPAKGPAIASRDASSARAAAPSGASKAPARAAAPVVPAGETVAPSPPTSAGSRTTSNSGKTPGSESAPAPAKKPARPIDDDREMWPIDDPPPAAGANTDRTPAVAAPAKPAPSDPTESRTATTEKAPSTTPPSTGPTASQPQPAKPATPLDRLHEATAKAAGEGDLIALRKLREAWKNYLRTSVGPERSRAKREFADCLWAIQLLSGRADDQRAALVAYRDFLLSAPAGGTDARSAARLRQLEEVTAERR